MPLLGMGGAGSEGEFEIRRTYAGRHQRAAGAWSWFLWPETRGTVGCYYTVGVMALCSNWDLYNQEFGMVVDPCRDCIKGGRCA